MRRLDDESIKKFRNRAIKTATAKGYAWAAEDFAQDFCLQMFEKGWRQTVDQAFIDFQRKMFGRTGECSDSTRQSRRNLQVPGNASKDPETYIRLVDQPEGCAEGSAGRSWVEALESCEYREGFESLNLKQQLVVFLLSDGWTQKKVGKLIGVTESRICQIVLEITCRRRLKKKKEEIASLMEATESLEMELTWLTL